MSSPDGASGTDGGTLGEGIPEPTPDTSEEPGGRSLAERVVYGTAGVTVLTLVLPYFTPADNVIGRTVEAAESGALHYTGYETQQGVFFAVLAVATVALVYVSWRGTLVLGTLLASFAGLLGLLELSFMFDSDPRRVVTVMPDGQPIPAELLSVGAGLVVAALAMTLAACAGWMLCTRAGMRWLRERRAAG